MERFDYVGVITTEDGEPAVDLRDPLDPGFGVVLTREDLEMLLAKLNDNGE